MVELSDKFFEQVPVDGDTSMEPFRLHGKVFAALTGTRGNASTVAPMAVAPSNERMIAGVAAASVSLGVAQLVGIPFGARADARAAIGSVVVDLTPGPIKEWAIQTLGSLDKLFLAVVVLVVIATIAAIAGSLETQRRPLGSAAIAAAGVLGCIAVLSRQGATALDTIPTVAGAVCGVAALRLLTRRLWPGPRDPEDEADHDEPDVGRRKLVLFGLLGFGVVSGVAGAVITRLVHSVAGDRNSFTLPRPRTSAPPIPADVQPNGVALPSFVTASADFYRVDTALSVPQLSHGDWRLRIHGMVDREITYSFDDLADFDVVEMVTTLTCVSNPVGGELISTGVWTGYRVADLLAAARVHADADMVLSTSIDGFTAGTPVEALTDGRDALLAVGLNGQPLPIEHGYPARLRSTRALRVRVGHQVGRRSGADPLRQSRGVLDAAGLGTARTHQDRVADRRAERWSERADRARGVRRCRVGTESWRAGRGGPHRRRRVAAR